MEITLLQPREIPVYTDLYVKFIDFLRVDCNEIFFEYIPEIKEKLIPYFERCLKDPNHAIYLAKENEKIIGFIAGDIRYSFFPYSSIGKIAYISAVYVDERARKKGLTKHLENYITENFFKKNNVDYVELYCLTKNTVAKKCWESLGYCTFREQLRKKLS
jgi:ribosomal protein S18 acetylase RimI-like enzyme